MPQIIEFASHGEQLAERALPQAASPRGRARKGAFYAMAEAIGDRNGSVTDRLCRELADAFYRDNNGSVTSSLLRAIRQVNQSLFSENERSIQAERQFATVVCAVVRDSDVYIGIVGSGKAYLVGNGPTQRISRPEDETDRSTSLLGQADEVRVEMFHRSLDPSGVIILATEGLADLLDQAMAQVPDIPPDRAIPLVRFLSPRRKAPFRAVAIDLGADSSATADGDRAPATAPASRLPQLSLRLPSIRARLGLAPPSRLMPQTAGRSPHPGEANREAEPLIQPAVRSPQMPRSTERRAPPQTWRLVDGRPDRPSPGGGASNPDQPEVADSHPHDSAPSRPRVASMPSLSSSRPQRVGYAYDPKPSVEHYAAIGDWPDDRSATRARGLLGSAFRVVPRARLPPSVRLGLVLLVIFTIGVFIAQVPLRWIQNGAAYANVVSRLTQAEQKERAALAQTDPQLRRQQLEEARRLALEAEALGPENTAVATTVARIQREYQSATGSIALPKPTRLVDLPTSSDRMVLRGIDLYVLDRADSRVYKYLLNADGTSVQPHSDPTLVRKGDRIGTRSVGDLTQMTWMPAGGTRTNPSLLILDRAGFLIQYDTIHGLSLLALSEPNAWGTVTGIDGLDGNLYALSPASRLLAWYPPQPTGYDGAAYNYFAPSTTIDLSDAAGFTLSDGLYLVSASGQIQKFDGGKPVAFGGPPSGLAPRHPSGLAVGGGSVFVGDPSNARIVQIATSGIYQQTLGGGENDAILGQIRDLAITDDGRALYVLTERAIDRFELPSPPAAR